MSVVFDGHDLGELFTCGEPELSILNATPTVNEVSSRNGGVFVGSRLGIATVAFQIVAIGTDAAERRNAFSTLGMWLDVDEPKRLVLPDTPDRYYLAVPNGALSIERHFDGEVTTLTFDLVDPIAYGREISITVPSGGSVTFNVGGTAKSKPRISSSAVRDSVSLVWGVRLDSADYVHVATGSDNAMQVNIDCDERTCIVGSNPGMITLDSNWLEFEPGAHTLVMDNGTGAATVTYCERWF